MEEAKNKGYYTSAHKTYYQRHKEKILAYNKDYRENHKDKCKEWSNNYYKAHKDDIIKRNADWRLNNKEKWNQSVAASRQNRINTLRELGVPQPYKYLKDKNYRTLINNELEEKSIIAEKEVV